MEKYISPHNRPNDYESEIYHIILEECSEVQKCICKGLRFGFNDSDPYNNKYSSNTEHLGQEIGELLEMVDLALKEKMIFQEDIEKGKATKRKKLPKYMQATKDQ